MDRNEHSRLNVQLVPFDSLPQGDGVKRVTFFRGVLKETHLIGLHQRHPGVVEETDGEGSVVGRGVVERRVAFAWHCDAMTVRCDVVSCGVACGVWTWVQAPVGSVRGP